MEDFRRNYESAKKVRKASYGNSWAKTVTGKWLPMTQTTFTADGTPSLAINAGKTDAMQHGFFMQTGGETKNVLKLRSNIAYPAAAAGLTPPKELQQFFAK